MVKKKKNVKKPDPERAEALKALPLNVRSTLTDEEAREFFERLAEAYRRRSAHYRGGPGK